MVVEADREAARRAIQAARHDDRDLAQEVDQRFQDAVAPAELLPGSGQGGAVGDADLALAVIALGAGFQDAGQCRGSGDVGLARDRLIVGGADAELAEELLLAQPVLGDMDRLHPGPHRLQLSHAVTAASGTFSNS